MSTVADNAAMSTRTLPVWAFHSMAKRAAINQLACVLIAVMLWLFRVDDSYWVGLVFSLLIGNACWLFIDGGRALVARWLHRRHGSNIDWPGWPWMAGIVVVGTLAGYLLGHAAAKAVLGLPPAKAQMHAPALLFSVMAALVVSYVFYARERLHTRQLEAEAAQRLASEMQLKLLQSQLEPHMLFNTLANLRVLIGLDPVQAQAMLDHLIGFLRRTLASTRVERHALGAEFEALDDYLALMAVRMGPRLQSRFELPAPLAHLPVPPLLLQPLVENAITHGLEPKVEGGRIEIGARRQGQQLQLRVRDTGVGPQGVATGVGTGFGLEQVRTRLAALYGDKASLTVQAASDGEGGSEALIVLPISVAARAA
jgi:hypothetical protein